MVVNGGGAVQTSLLFFSSVRSFVCIVTPYLLLLSWHCSQLQSQTNDSVVAVWKWVLISTEKKAIIIGKMALKCIKIKFKQSISIDFVVTKDNQFPNSLAIYWFCKYRHWPKTSRTETFIHPFRIYYVESLTFLQANQILSNSNAFLMNSVWHIHFFYASIQ